MKYYPPHIVSTLFLGFRREWGGPPDARFCFTAAMEFIGGGASRGVKSHGFATPPFKNFKKDLKKTLGTDINIDMRASAGLHVPDHIHRCPVMHD